MDAIHTVLSLLKRCSYLSESVLQGRVPLLSQIACVLMVMGHIPIASTRELQAIVWPALLK